MLGLALNVWRPAIGGVASGFNPATQYASGTTGAWFTADDNTYLKVNTNGTGGLVADGGMIGRWDDRSGSGNHIVKIGAALGPIYKASPGCADYFLRTDGGTTNATLRLTTLVTNLARANNTGGAVVWIPGTEKSAIVDLGAPGSSLAIQAGQRDNTPFCFIFDGASFINTSLRHRARKGYVAWRNNGTTFDIWVNGALYTRAGFSAATITSLFTGTFAGGLPGPMRLQELALFNGVFDDTKMASFRSYLEGKAGFASVDTTRTVDILGDSLSIGTGSQTGVPWHYRPEVTNRPNSLWRSAAYGGAYLSSSPPIAAAAMAAGKGSAEGIAVLWSGTNDILTGLRTGAQWSSDMVAYSGTLRAAGMKVVACTLQHFVTNNAARITGNAALVAASASFDAIVRLDTAPELDDATDTTYYTSDGVHLKDAGYAAAATLINAGLASV